MPGKDDNFYAWRMRQNFRSVKNKDRASPGLRHFNMIMRWAGKNRMVQLLTNMAHHLSNGDARWIATLNNVIRLAKTTAQKYGYSIPAHKIAKVKELAYKVANDHQMSPGKILKCFDDIKEQNFATEDALVKSLGEALGDFIGFVLQIDEYNEYDIQKAVVHDYGHVGHEMLETILDNGKIGNIHQLVMPSHRLKGFLNTHHLDTKNKLGDVSPTDKNQAIQAYYHHLSHKLGIDPLDHTLDKYHDLYRGAIKEDGQRNKSQANPYKVGFGDAHHASVIAATLAAIYKHHKNKEGHPSSQAKIAGAMLRTHAPAMYSALNDGL